MRTALEELEPERVIAGCHVDRHLEIDHNEPLETGGVTAIWNLSRVCHRHHRVKTAENLRIVGEGSKKVLVPRASTTALSVTDERARRAGTPPSAGGNGVDFV